MDNSAIITVKKQNKLALYFSVAAIAVATTFFQFNFISSIGIGLSLFISIRFVIMLGRSIPVIELMLFIAALQWIIGPLIDYHTKIDHYKMYMYVSEEVYMGLTVPMLFSFALSSLFITKIKIIDIEKMKQLLTTNKVVPIVLILLGMLSIVASSFLPPSILFITYLIKNFTLVGIGLILVNDYSWRDKILISFIAILPITYQSISTGMFHTLIIWFMFIFIFFNLVVKLTFLRKIIIIFAGFLFLSVLQFIKKDFREEITANKNSNKIEVFVDMLFESEAVEELQEEDDINNVNRRLNQGWIISKIYERIPKKKPFYNGQTIKTAVEALIPRILYPDKKTTGGGKETFELLTGIILFEGTAMGASLLGEFYGNYGFWGGILAFVIWGLMLHYIVQKIHFNHLKNPYLYFFLPIIFLQVIKAESDLTTVLNHLVKSLIIILPFTIVLKNLLNYNSDKTIKSNIT